LIANQPDVIDEKGLPCNLDAERFVLGLILKNHERYFPIAAGLEPDNFILERHRRIFAAMRHLHANGDDIDRVVVADQLAKLGQLGTDGLSFLASLDDGMPDIPNADDYVKIIIEKATLRGIIFESQRFSNGAALQIGPARELLAEHAARMQQLSARGGTMTQSIVNVLLIRDCGNTNIEYLREPELPRGMVIALTGDSGCGKSTLATAWAAEAAEAGVPVLVLDRENPLPVVAERLDRLGVVDGPMFKYCGAWLPTGVPEPDSPAVIAWVMSCEVKPLIIVDSMAAFHGGDENDAQQMRAFTQKCRTLADLGATVIIIHHDGKADSAKDYRGSSDFKANVDQAFHVSNFGPDGRLGVITLRVFKGRTGLAGKITYHYEDGEFLRGSGTQDLPAPAADQFRDLLRNNPGRVKNEFERLAAARGLGRDRARAWLDEGVPAGKIRREPKPGRGGAWRHYLEMEC
jgi:replicative DNA helicase